MKSFYDGLTNNNSNPLNELLGEYSNINLRIDGLTSKIIQLIVFLIGGLGGVIGFTYEHKFSPELYWGFSIIIYIISGIILFLFAEWSHLALQSRIVCWRITNITGELSLSFFFHKDSIPSRFASLRRGNEKYRSMILLLFFIVAVLIFSAWFYSFERIYSEDHFLGLIFVIIFIFLSTILISALYSILCELPKLYDKIFTINEEKRINDEIIKIEKENNKTNVFKIFIPRPLDLLTKTWLFLIGAVFIYWEGGVVPNPRISDLLIGPKANVCSALPLFSTPKWTIIAFSLIWFITQEVIIQQAKYLWNDIRDKKHDSEYQEKKDRFFYSEEVNTNFAVIMLLVRMCLGLTISSFLDPRLLILALIILIIQVIYDFYLKPRLYKKPFPLILILATGTIIRIIGGGLSVGSLFSLRFFILILIFFFFGIGSLSTYYLILSDYRIKINKSRVQKIFHESVSHFIWKKNDAINVKKTINSYRFQKNKSKDIKTHNKFIDSINNYEKKKKQLETYNKFLHSMTRYKLFGFVFSIFSSTFLLFYSLFPRIVDFNIQSLYNASFLLKWLNFQFFELIIIISSIVLIGFPIYLLITFKNGKNSWILITFIPMGISIMILTISQSLPFQYGYIQIISGVVILAFTTISNFLYKKITYEQYMFLYAKRNFKFIYKIWFEYLFNSYSNFNFFTLVRATLNPVKYQSVFYSLLKSSNTKLN